MAILAARFCVWARQDPVLDKLEVLVHLSAPAPERIDIRVDRVEWTEEVRPYVRWTGHLNIDLPAGFRFEVEQKIKDRTPDMIVAGPKILRIYPQ